MGEESFVLLDIILISKRTLRSNKTSPSSSNHFSYALFPFSSLFYFTDIYRLMLSDKKYGLSVNLMATRVMPSLLPQTVNPSLNLEQFTILLEVLQEMLDHIDRYERSNMNGNFFYISPRWWFELFLRWHIFLDLIRLFTTTSELQV